MLAAVLHWHDHLLTLWRVTNAVMSGFLLGFAWRIYRLRRSNGDPLAWAVLCWLFVMLASVIGTSQRLHEGTAEVFSWGSIPTSIGLVCGLVAWYQKAGKIVDPLPQKESKDAD